MSKLGTIFKVIGQFAPQVLALTKLAPIAPQVATAMQVAQAFEKKPGENQSDLNQRRLQSVLVEAQTAAAAVNAQAGRTVIDPTEVASVGAGIIESTKNTVNLINAIHTAPSGNALPTSTAPPL